MCPRFVSLSTHHTLPSHHIVFPDTTHDVGTYLHVILLRVDFVIKNAGTPHGFIHATMFGGDESSSPRKAVGETVTRWTRYILDDCSLITGFSTNQCLHEVDNNSIPYLEVLNLSSRLFCLRDLVLES
jgi:hypothetical protein